MRRSPIVLLLGVANLAYGSLGLCSALMTAILAIAMFWPIPDIESDPATEVLFGDAIYRGFQVASAPITLVASLALIASGLGLLAYARWARYLALGYAVLGLLHTAAAFIAMLIVASRVHGKLGPEVPDFPSAVGFVGGTMAVTSCCNMGMVLYPLLLLVILLQPSVAAGIGQELPPSEDPFGPTTRMETGNPFQSPR